MQVWKIAVQKGKMCNGGKYKYGKASTSKQGQYYYYYYEEKKKIKNNQ